MYKYHTRGQRGLEANSSLEGLSQITVDKDEIEKFEFVDSTTELQLRLQELENITLSFLTERPLTLTTLSDAFADIDDQENQEFEFYIPEFTRNDVLCLDIVCISDSIDSTIQNPTQMYSKTISHEPLEVILKSVNEESKSFLPSYHNGEYEFVLTSAHGMTAGRFIVHVKNVGNSPQSVRAHLNISPYVAATPLVSGETVYRRNLPRKAEFSYFRFLMQDPSQLLSIRVNSLRGENGEESDPDIYVSNKYSGLVRVNRDNYIWRSAMIGSDQIDIHPQYDIRTLRGSTFLIGVTGQNDLFQDFSITVTALSPPPIISLLSTGYSRDFIVRSDQYTYFSIPVDPTTVAGKIVIIVEPLSVKGSSAPNANTRELESRIETLTQQRGRGLYTEDSLFSAGLTIRDSQNGGTPALTIIDSNSQHSFLANHHPSPFLNLTIPSSVSKTEGLFPLAYFSDHSLYPTSQFYVWRSSGLTGELRAFIETSEWKYSDSKTCYMSLIGASFPNEDNHSSKSLHCRITLTAIEDVDTHDEIWKRKLEMFEKIFEEVDGSAISQQDRSRRIMSSEDRSVERVDPQGLTYGEVDLCSFLKILHASQARDNHVFVDLGCGVGKALIAAAISGIKFMRCIGIELLPGLCAEAKKAVEKTKLLAESADISVPLMEIWEGDICDPNLTAWTDADLVFMSSLCFPDQVVQKLMKLARNMRPGTMLLTLKSPEPYLESFELVSASWFKMTWGRVMVYFLRRKPENP